MKKYKSGERKLKKDTYYENHINCEYIINEQMNTGDIIQMNTGILLIDKKGNIIEIKAPQPEYIKDSIF